VYQLKSTSEFAEILFSFRLAFSKRSWPYLLAMAVPWVLLSGQRSVRRLGAWVGHRRHRSSYYRFFSDFKFRREAFFRALLDLILSTFQPAELRIAIDDTICPKWGRHIFGTARLYDSSRSGFLWGHNWVVFAAVVPLFGVPVALPFCVLLYRPRKTCPADQFRTRLELVIETLTLVRQWTPLPLRVLADGAYFNGTLLGPLGRLGIPMVSRLRSDAILRRDPPKRRRRKPGRPALYGRRLPALGTIASSPTGWRTTIVNIYRRSVRLQVKTFDAWWPACGQKIRVVLSRDPLRQTRPAFLVSTDLSLSPEDLLHQFSLRWTIEQMFSDVKHSMGLDSAEVRKPHSVLRHAALTMGMITVVRVWAARSLSASTTPPVSFARQLAELRGDILAQTLFPASPRTKGSRRNAKALCGLLAA
jgi:hypothetical protein